MKDKHSHSSLVLDGSSIDAQVIEILDKSGQARAEQGSYINIPT